MRFVALFVFFATWVCQPQDTGAKAPAYIEDERKSYDKIYSTERETFSAEPNAFLVRMISGRNPGRALDVAMGQGRNSIWLASQGWSVMGFDISPVGIEQAQGEALKPHLNVQTQLPPSKFSHTTPQNSLPTVLPTI